MRFRIYAIIVICLLIATQWGGAQDDQPEIKIDRTTATYEKISDNNYKLTFQWTPFPGAHTYRIRFIDKLIDIEDPVTQLTKNQLTENDTSSITLNLGNNNAMFQVVALDETRNELAQSCVYRATLSFDESPKSLGIQFPFFRAFFSSFKEMDPFAGWAIVAFIILLFLYGSSIAWSINREVKRQNHEINHDLGRLVAEYLARWRANSTNATELEAIKEEITRYKDKKYAIFSILEIGLQNHIDNMGKINVSEEVDRDMEKTIYYELEKLKLGNYSDRKKHITLNRVKMFGETAPMLGLLGTVSGLIVAFFNILQTSGDGGNYQDLLQELSSGIYSAIVTTIIGLICGIFLLFIHHGVESNVKRLENVWFQTYIKISKEIGKENDA